jgi:hypothetical protein
MRHDSCDIDILIRNDLNINELDFKSNAPDVFIYKTVEYCSETASTNSKCSKQNINEFKNISPICNYTLAIVKLESVVIGNGSLIIYSRNNSVRLFEQSVIVASPRRVVDILLDVYGFAFGVTISILMGILVDRSSLMKIIKMPKPIAIGFLCQYLLMPLVTSFQLLSVNLIEIKNK